jgi:hypothetical protein
MQVALDAEGTRPHGLDARAQHPLGLPKIMHDVGVWLERIPSSMIDFLG